MPEFKILTCAIHFSGSRRSFAYVDKIGALTDAFLANIPGTEIQYGATFGDVLIRNEQDKTIGRLNRSQLTFQIDEFQDVNTFKNLFSNFFDVVVSFVDISYLNEIIISWQAKYPIDSDQVFSFQSTLKHQIFLNQIVSEAALPKAYDVFFTTAVYEYRIGFSIEEEEESHLLLRCQIRAPERQPSKATAWNILDDSYGFFTNDFIPFLEENILGADNELNNEK